MNLSYTWTAPMDPLRRGPCPSYTRTPPVCEPLPYLDRPLRGPGNRSNMWTRLFVDPSRTWVDASCTCTGHARTFSRMWTLPTHGPPVGGACVRELAIHTSRFIFTASAPDLHLGCGGALCHHACHKNIELSSLPIKKDIAPGVPRELWRGKHFCLYRQHLDATGHSARPFSEQEKPDPER